MRPELDQWVGRPALRVGYERRSQAGTEALWEAARAVRLGDTGLLGRLVRLRIPGLARGLTFDELFHEPPFVLLGSGERWIVSGLVGRIWTLRRDYPRLESPAEFREWSRPGTAKVAFALWAEDLPEDPGSRLGAEARVEGLGPQGRVGVASVRPLVSAFGGLVGSEGIAAAVRRAERGAEDV